MPVIELLITCPKSLVQHSQEGQGLERQSDYLKDTRTKNYVCVCVKKPFSGKLMLLKFLKV